MFYLLSNLAALVGLAVIFAVSGLLLERALMGDGKLQPSAWIGRIGLGTALWMGLLFISAAVGQLRTTAVVLVLLFLLVGLMVSARVGRPLLVRDTARQRGRLLPESLIVGVAVCGVLLALWVQTLWPQISWDADTYHLTVPRLYLENGGFRRIPFNVYSNWPLNTELLFALAMLMRDYVLAKQVHFGFGLATLASIYVVARVARDSWVGWLAAILFLANPIVMQEMRVAYVDLAFAFFFFLAFVCLHEALENEGRRDRFLLVGGVFGGVAAGIKPTGLVAAFCLAIGYLGVVWRRRERRSQWLVGLAWLLVPAALILAPWLAKSWLTTGNPVYPFLYGIFGGPEWSTELGEQLRSWQLRIGMGREWDDYLLLPWRVIVAGQRGYEHFDGRLHPLWLVVIPLAVWAARSRPFVRRSLWVTTLYFFLWSLSSQQMRFLIAVLPFLAVSGAVGIGALADRLPVTGSRWARICASVILAALLLTVEIQLAPQAWSMLRSYFTHGELIKGVAIKPIFDAVDKQLPKEAKLLFLNTNHGFFCRRDFIADSFFEASQINALMKERQSKEEVHDLLADLEVSHLLIENRDRHVPWPRVLFDYLNDSRYVRLLFRSVDGAYDLVEILRIRPS